MQFEVSSLLIGLSAISADIDECALHLEEGLLNLGESALDLLKFL